MYRIDSVIHGMISPLNHSTGLCANDVYPSAGTQLNRGVLCRPPWVIRLATWPTQNTGAEMPMSARIISTGSGHLPRNLAAATPMVIATMTQITAAPITRDKVAGAAAPISGTTSTPWFEYETRLRLMKRLFIISRYWTGSGRSSPNWARISARICGLALRPAIARAGSTPGVLKKMKKTSTEITNKTSTVHRLRRTTNVSMSDVSRHRGPHARTGHDGRTPLALHPDLGPRVQRIPHAVAQYVQRQYREHDHDPGRHRHPGPAVQQVLAVADDRAPAYVGRLHADGQERQRGLEDDVGRDHQRQEHDHRGHHVRQDLREDQPQVGRALGDRGLHELLGDHREHLAADGTVHVRQVDERDDRRGHPQTGRLDEQRADPDTAAVGE